MSAARVLSPDARIVPSMSTTTGTVTRLHATDVDRLIAYHVGQAAYSLTVRTPADVRRRVLRRHRQVALNAALGLRTSLGRRA